MAAPRHLTPDEFAPVLADLELEAGEVRVIDPAPPAVQRKSARHEPGSVLVGQIGTGLDIPTAAEKYRGLADEVLTADGWALFFFKDARTDGELARWRNALWPWLHAMAWYRFSGGRIERETLREAQTPQGFRRPVLSKAIARAMRDGFHGTDEAALVERLGEPGRQRLGAQRRPRP